MIALTPMELLERMRQPQPSTLTIEEAQEYLSLDFREEDRECVDRLLEKARLGVLNEAESEELESFNRINFWLIQIHSQARRTLGVRLGPQLNGKAR